MDLRLRAVLVITNYLRNHTLPYKFLQLFEVKKKT